MSLPLHPGYRFTTEAQWQSCLFSGADRSSSESRAGLRPFAPYGLPATLFETPGAHAPAYSDAAELLWHDDAGRLQRLPYGDEQPQGSAAPRSVGRARRMVAMSDTLWTVDDEGSLQAFDLGSLSQLFRVDLDGHEAIDIAGDGRDGVYVLVAWGRLRRIVHVNRAGGIDSSLRVDEPAEATAMVSLGQSGTLVLLGSQGSKLYWFDLEAQSVQRIILVTALRPCFEVIAIGSDGCARLFLAGTDGAAAGGAHRVLMLDVEGNLLSTVPVEAPPTGVVARRSLLFVTTAKGVMRFDPAVAVPQGSGEVTASALTPLLRSPSQLPQRWLRIEARGVLPPGCSIEIAYGAASDPELQEQMETALRDGTASPARRLDQWRRDVIPRTFAFRGDPQLSPGEETVLSAPLHDVREEHLRVQVTLIAAPGGRMPVLSELSVLYPGPTLIEQLPAIYRSGELESGDFLRALVGVLEAGTQQLDAKIGSLGRLIHPETASDEWLDFVASWLGLPWDETLSLGQKRRIAGNAALITGSHGMRAGLETLLDSLLPERPRRFRIVDGTADFGLATVGGIGCEGSQLPAILSGLPCSAVELGNKAILGKARLPCGDPEPETARLLGRIRIDIMASAEERLAWSPWMASLIESMLPATTRAEVRWWGPSPMAGADRLGEALTLENEPLARLGTDSVTGAARLGGRKRTTLPVQLSDDSTLH